MWIMYSCPCLWLITGCLKTVFFFLDLETSGLKGVCPNGTSWNWALWIWDRNGSPWARIFFLYNRFLYFWMVTCKKTWTPGLTSTDLCSVKGARVSPNTPGDSGSAGLAKSEDWPWESPASSSVVYVLLWSPGTWIRSKGKKKGESVAVFWHLRRFISQVLSYFVKLQQETQHEWVGSPQRPLRAQQMRQLLKSPITPHRSGWLTSRGEGQGHLVQSRLKGRAWGCWFCSQLAVGLHECSCISPGHGCFICKMGPCGRRVCHSASCLVSAQWTPGIGVLDEFLIGWGLEDAWGENS